jgi:hypothetical protein
MTSYKVAFIKTNAFKKKVVGKNYYEGYDNQVEGSVPIYPFYFTEDYSRSWDSGNTFSYSSLRNGEIESIDYDSSKLTVKFLNYDAFSYEEIVYEVGVPTTDEKIVDPSDHSKLFPFTPTEILVANSLNSGEPIIESLRESIMQFEQNKGKIPKMAETFGAEEKPICKCGWELHSDPRYEQKCLDCGKLSHKHCQDRRKRYTNCAFCKSFEVVDADESYDAETFGAELDEIQDDVAIVRNRMGDAVGNIDLNDHDVEGVSIEIYNDKGVLLEEIVLGAETYLTMNAETVSKEMVFNIDIDDAEIENEDELEEKGYTQEEIEEIGDELNNVYDKDYVFEDLRDNHLDGINGDITLAGYSVYLKSRDEMVDDIDASVYYTTDIGDWHDIDTKNAETFEARTYRKSQDRSNRFVKRPDGKHSPGHLRGYDRSPRGTPDSKLDIHSRDRANTRVKANIKGKEDLRDSIKFEANAKSGDKVYIITRRCEDYSAYRELDLAVFSSLTEARKKFNYLFKEEKENYYADETIADAKDYMRWGEVGWGIESFMADDMIYELREQTIGNNAMSGFYFDAESHGKMNWTLNYDDYPNCCPFHQKYTDVMSNSMPCGDVLWGQGFSVDIEGTQYDIWGHEVND